MGGISIWHWLILALVAIIPAVIAITVVVRLSQPLEINGYGPPPIPMASGQALVSGLRKYATFTGRAGRSEFWWFLFWAALVEIAACAGMVVAARSEDQWWPAMIVSPLIPTVFYLPLLAVTVRRLQDANRSGLWVLMAFSGTSVLGLLLLLAEPSRDG